MGRIGKFAWARTDPIPGRYDWGWLDRAIEALGNAGLQIVLGPPLLPRRAGWVKIVTARAKRYGKDPHVAAWQTDNEYCCHNTTLSHPSAVLHAFRDWLARY